MPQENSLVRHTPSSGTRELFFSCTIHPGQGWPVGKYFGLGAVRFMPHTSQWSLSWQPLATNLCNTSGLKTQSSIEVGWLADRLNFAHLGYRVSIIRVGFSQKQVISLQTITVNIHMCRGCSSPLPLCLLDLPCTQALLICSVSLSQ